MEAEKLAPKGQAWFCTTGLPSDTIVEVDGMSFHLHKFPLMAKSGRLQRLITELEEHPTDAPRRRRGQGEVNEDKEPREDEGVGEIKEEEAYPHILLADFPVNCEAFETAAKFCYGVKIDLNAWNVAPLRCVAEYLEMTEEFGEDNLVARAERFLARSVLPSIKQSIKTLKSCEDLMPLADDLGIAQRCVDAIAIGASSSDPDSLFGWPVNEGRGGGSSEQILWNGIETGLLRRRTGVRSSSFAAADAAAGSWLEDLAILSLPMYKRVIDALKAREVSSDAIEGSLMSYAHQSIPGLFRSRRKHSSAPLTSEPEQRELLETVIANLPLERSSVASAAAATATTKFLFGLLRTAHILHASEAARAALERKIAFQVERATLDDLLIPSYSYLSETLYDVDCVERIVAHYLDSLEAERAALAAEGEVVGGAARTPSRAGSLKLVGKLVDGYLAEIASDANLKVDKFYGLAVALPDDARVYHDGLYRAVDIYLKAHPRMTEEEKEKVCGVMDCRKLTLEACTHAAQNERLPLRAVVQVLFFEQLQLRRVITGTLLAADGEAAAPAAGGDGGGAWRASVRENQVLRLDMDSMRSRVQELERECSSMKKTLAKLDEGGEGGAAAGEEEGEPRRKKERWFGCRFSTQVCDSHEGNVVESRRVGRELSS
ncbi:hypothetical protein OPV22_014803 [Ensete ventricosum]|uniref:NPH3 domain-containing protein n=1 Tax=Ensete ventricosum TaxID=4639 RepID=A0AAV8R8V2_ENSVE|nr:hypothetical protein OPV22_014803 [Ensete ventricosum]